MRASPARIKPKKSIGKVNSFRLRGATGDRVAFTFRRPD